MMRFGSLGFFVVFFVLAGAAQANSTFDLTGPPLDVRVTRAGKTLPISQVPNLEAGDRVWLHPDFPQEQTARYLLVAVFLRGSTNPPPDSWFVRAQTWKRPVRDEGIYVTVPPEAQQALFFLAPETGGDFGTLRSNVQAKPGAFVRAAQDLNQASLDRSRLDAYLAAVTRVSLDTPDTLQTSSKLLSRSLNIKVDNTCFDKPPALQLPCLTKDTSAIVLDDGHTESMVSQLTSGNSADLIGHLSSAPMAGAGMYSPYVGAIVDAVRIMNGIHTAQYQYIPALVESQKDQLQLKLNNPPSFSNPKSVLTVGLPAVQPPQLPPIRAVHPDRVYCADGPSLVLPVEGAPLIYSTDLAHDFVLHVQGKGGKALDLPARPEAVNGGFVVDTHTVELASMDPEITGILRGFWGFEPFEGPTFRLQSSHRADWSLPQADESALVVGREDTLHLKDGSAACVNQVSVREPAGTIIQAKYNLVKPDELEVHVPLQNASPGTVTLLVQQAGMTAPDQVKVQAYSEAAHLVKFTIHAGDTSGKLEGARLDEVSKFDMKGATFTPGELKRSGNEDELTLTATGPVSGLKAGERVTAHATLKDGRKVELPVTVQPARPSVALVSKSVDTGPGSSSPAVRLTNPDELPQDATLNFVLRSPSAWPRTEKIEVATTDEAFHAMLNVEDGSLTLQDSKTVLATLNPLKSFGPSAFGPLRFRPVDGSGTEGDWQALGNLVRIPTLKEVHCPASPEKTCVLSGSNLFLLDSVSSSRTYRSSVPVPVGFADSTLNVPRPIGTLLYFKLRDDPTAVNVIALPVLPD